MHKHILSKLRLINSERLDPKDVPNEVLAEIMMSHNTTDLKKNRDLLIDIQNMNARDLSKIARFLNPISWTASTLKQALQFYLLFENPKSLQISPFRKITFGVVHVGYPTPEKPYSLSPCILYAYCLQHSIKVSNKTTSEEMLRALEYFFSHRSINEVTKDLSEMPTSFYCRLWLLLSEYGRIPPDIPNVELNPKIIDVIFNKFKDREITIRPNDDNEAYVYGILKYRIDLSFAMSPIREYMNIEDHVKKSNLKKYIPLYTKLSDWIDIKYSHIKSPYIDYAFKMELPQFVYNRSQLMNIGFSYGMTIDDMNIPIHNTLMNLALSETFYPGFESNIINSSSLIDLDPIAGLDRWDVICYGIRDSWMVLFKYSELIDVFKNCNNFKNPGMNDNSEFKLTTINRLFWICQQEKMDDEPEKSYQTRLELSKMITKVKLYNQKIDNSFKEFVDNVIDKNILEDVIIKLHIFAMCLRGWLGGDLPISTAIVLSGNEYQVEEASMKALIDLELSLDQLGNLKENFYQLPTYKYKNGYVFNGEPKTILDRIALIQSGDKSNIDACIRINSNYMAATSYYLAAISNISLGYDINQLSYIS